MSEMILKMDDVSKHYPNFSLEHISLELPKGCIMGLVGANGAGKTTTIKLILDLIPKESGNISLFGQDYKDKELRQDIGVVFDENNFPENLTPAQIEKIMKNIYRGWDTERYHQLLVRFGLTAPKKTVKDFSRGMKMKLSLAVAMGHRAKLLILDEPTSGLDPIVRNEILDLFLEFIEDEECSILLSSHITSDLEKVADYITIIDNGKVLLSESKDELIYQYGIVKGGKEGLAALKHGDCLGMIQNSYGFEALVSDKELARRNYPDMVVDSASLEDILMLLTRKTVG